MATITQMAFRINSLYNGDGLRQARRDYTNLDSSIRALNKSWQAVLPGMRDVVSMIMGLGPALIPITGAFLAMGGAATSAMVGAGAAVGIFGAAMKGAISQTVGANSAFGVTKSALENAEKALSKTVKGTKEYDEALKKVTAAEKAHQQAINALPPVQRNFANSIVAVEEAWTNFIKSTMKYTLKPATTAVEAATLAIPKLTSVVAAVSPVFQSMADSTKGWVQDGGLDRFLRTVITYGVPALNNFKRAAISMLTVMGNGFRTFAPLGVEFTEFLVRGAQSMERWANGGGFGRFVGWLYENGPGVVQVLKDLGTFLRNLGVALAGMSGSAIAVLGTFFRVLASFPPGLLQAMMYAFIALSAILKIYAVVALAVAAATTIMTLSLSPAAILMIGVATTIGAVVLALAALAVGIYFLVKHWDTVMHAIKTTAVTVWGWLKTAWEATWNAIKTAATTVWDFLTNGWGQFLLLFMGPIGLIIAVAANWEMIWGGIKSVALTVWGALTTAWNATVGGILTAWNAVIAPIMESWNTVWPEMSQAAKNIWNGLKIAWEFVWSGIRAVWEAFWGEFGPTFRAGWSGITETAKAMWTALTAAWQLVWSIIQGIYQTAWAILSGAWSVGWTYLTETAKIAWAVFSGAWSVLWTVIQGVWNVFYATFSAIFSAAWNTIMVLVTGIWNVIKAAWDALWKTITAIFMTFAAIFTGNWSGAWNAIKDAAMAIWNLLRTAFQSFLNYLRSILDGFISIVKAAWSAFWTAVQATASAAWAALRNLFQVSLTAVQNLWNTVWTAIRNIFQTIVNAIMSIAQAWWSAFRAALNAFLTSAQALWNTVWTAIRNFFQTISTGVQTIANGLWDGIRAIFSAGSNWLRTTFWNPVNNFFTKTIPSAFETAKNALGKAWDGIRKLVRDPIQAIVNVVYNNGIVKLWNAVAGVFGADKLSNFTLPAFSRGGSTGAGPGREKRGFPAILHPNEHVWTSREVAAAGGHEAVARMRSQALRGQRVRTYGNRVFDDGGGFLGTGIGPDVGPDLVPDGIISNVIGKLKDVVLGGVYKVIEGPINAAVKAAQSAVRGIIPGSPMLEDLATKIPRKMADVVLAWIKEKDVAPTVAGGSVEAALTWARTQVGKPYQWGGVGPAGYDCSGFMSAIQNVIMGDKTHQRKWATAAFSGSVAPGGWKKSEKAPFMVGITNAGVGHTAGTLNGVNVESSGGVGVRVGGGARGYNNGMFPDWYGFLPSKTASGGTSPAAAKATAKGMLGGYGWSGHWPALEALWTRESGWRWNADNPTSDAYGIPQSLPGSKMASAGKDWKTNPATQIKWGLGYIKGRYGNPTAANNFQKANNWYGYGTRSASPGWGVVGDRGIEVMKMRGGEEIQPLESLVSRDSGGVNLTLHIDARGATVAAVQRLENELPDKLRMALEQGVGRKP